jgi:hypothetical protein
MNRTVGFYALWAGLIAGLLVFIAPGVRADQNKLCAEIYVTQANDWLSKIAEKFLGDITAFPAIIVATNTQHSLDSSFAQITNPDAIEAGWKICIPLTPEAEAILTQEIAPPAPMLEPPPPQTTSAVFKLDNFVQEHTFSPEVKAEWIYSSPPPVVKYNVSPEMTASRDSYGYRANYYWNEHLSDKYFLTSGIFSQAPEQVKVYAAPWGTALPRYRYPPNVTLPTGLTTNQYGWRGPAIELKKPARTIRLAAVGGSTTVDGHTMPFSYPEYLQNWLHMWSQANGLDVNFEVLNTGREGLNSNDIAAVVHYEVLPMDVDYLIYYEGSNQFHPETVVWFPPEYTMGHPPAGVIPNFANIESTDKTLLDQISEYSALAARARNIVEQFMVTGQEPPKPEQTFHLPEGIDENRPDPAKLDNALDLKRILGDLDTIKQDADAHNIRMIMTTFNWFAYEGMVLDPSRHRNLYGYLNRLYWPISYANIRRAADFQNRVFKQWAADNQSPLADVAGEMPRQPDLYDDAIHNTTLGSRIRAWLIFEDLLPLLKKDIETGRLPQPARLNYTEHPYLTPDYTIRQLTSEE